VLKPTRPGFPSPVLFFTCTAICGSCCGGERHIFVCAVLLLVAAQTVLLAVPVISGRALNALQLHGRDGLREAGFWLSTVAARGALELGLTWTRTYSRKARRADNSPTYVRVAH